MRQRLAALCLAALLAGSAHADSGLNIVVILDNSGSMETPMVGGDSRMAVAKRSLLSVLEQTPDDAQVGVVLFNPPRLNDHWLIPLGPVDRAATRRAIGRIRAGGPTPLGSAMKIAADALLGQRDDRKYGDYKLLMVTDGEATDQTLVDKYLPEVLARGLMADVIGVDMGEQHSLAARSSSYRSAMDSASLERAISAVVMGESSYDNMDAGETDFELLEGLPAELATAALAALTSPPNTPIGGGGFVPPPQANRAGPPAANGGGGPGNPQVVVEDGGGFQVPWFVVLIVVFLVIRLMSAAKKHR